MNIEELARENVRRLTPYQCSAGVWTSGLGHTAGVVPKG